MQRAASASRKHKEAAQLKTQTTGLSEQIKKEKDSRRESLQHQKELQSQLQIAQPVKKAQRRSTMKSFKPSLPARADSCGRVKGPLGNTKMVSQGECNSPICSISFLTLYIKESLVDFKSLQPSMPVPPQSMASDDSMHAVTVNGTQYLLPSQIHGPTHASSLTLGSYPL